MLIVTTLLASGLGVYASHVRIERDKSRRVAAFNMAIDQQRYDAAGRLAEAAIKQYPNDDVMRCMVYKWQVVDALVRREEPEHGFVCQIVDDEQPVFELSESAMKSWKDLSRRRRAP